MPETRSITLPLTDSVVRELHAGDRILLSGSVYTARDAAHKRLVEALNAATPLPFDLRGQVVYYVGPSPTRPGDVIGSAGPTTAGRVDSYTVPLLQQGLKGMIGKGKRTPEIRQALCDFTAVYFVAVGGAAALIADRIRAVELIAYEDLGTEAIRRLTIDQFPLVVANDCYGADLYEQGRAAYRREERP
jgi:fumarate hydratase subunit beta